MPTIKILGAGLSGLSAAINLAKAGKKVEVFEKNADCGKRFNGDMQGLENWSKDKDVLDELLEMNIENNFDITSYRKVTFTNCNDSEDFYFDRALFYLIQRGGFKGSIDYGFKEQALKVGVKIYFNKTIKPSEADIVATGPSTKKVAVADKGIIFKTDLENMSVGIINDEAAIKGYSYLLVADGLACLCSCVFNDLEKLDDCFLYTKNYFTREYELKIKDEKKVGGIGYVSIDNVYKKGQTLFVGEAAGIQDLLGMFGMRTAIRSGFLASKAILEKLDYEKLAKDEFKKHIEAGVVNRYVWEHHDFDNYLVAMKKINQRVHSTDWLKSIYNFNLIEHIEYPVALHWIKKQYPELLN